MSERPFNWRPWFAAAGIGLVLIVAAWPSVGIRMVVLTATAIALAGVAVSLIRALWPRDRYDLATLRKVEDQAQRREAYDQVPDVFVDRLLCAVCGEEYELKYSSCPNCQKHL